MTVYDLWYRSVPGEDGKRVPKKRPGRGKRWRVQLPDGSSKSFDRRPTRKRTTASPEPKRHKCRRRSSGT